MDFKLAAKYRQIIDEFTIMDDIFMRKILSDKDCCNLVLNIILDREDLQVKSIQSQKNYTNLVGHSLIMDIVAEDEKGNIYNIEIQNDKKGAIPQRARYHSAIIDTNTLKKSTDFSKLPHTYVIFITSKDTLGDGEIIYHIHRVIEKTGRAFNDGTHIIYVNASIKDNTKLGKLTADFTEKDYKKMNYKVLSEKVKVYKEDEKEEKLMSTVLERFREEVIAEGMQKGIQEGMQKGIQEGMQKGIQEGMQKNKELIKRMYEEGIEISLIEKISGYSKEKIISIVDDRE